MPELWNQKLEYTILENPYVDFGLLIFFKRNGYLAGQI